MKCDIFLSLSLSLPLKTRHTDPSLLDFQRFLPDDNTFTRPRVCIPGFGLFPLCPRHATSKLSALTSRGGAEGLRCCAKNWRAEEAFFVPFEFYSMMV